MRPARVESPCIIQQNLSSDFLLIQHRSTIISAFLFGNSPCVRWLASLPLVMEFFESDELSERVNELLLSHHVPGVSLAIIDGGEISSKCFGEASIDPKSPCTPSTLFDIASSSKSLTAAAVAILVMNEEHPEVQWDTPVAKLLPDDFVLSDVRYTNEVTVEDILSHRSGLPK